MARFGERRVKRGFQSGLILPVCFFVIVAVIIVGGLGSLEGGTNIEQFKSTELAIRRAVVHCYAVEGRYPPNIGYVEERYGVIVDHEKYLIHYQPIASNLMPDILVIPLNTTEQ